MRRTATFIMDVERAEVRGDQRLYKVDPPMVDDDGESHEYVVVSAVTGWFEETYIFPADENGRITDWGELEGSTGGIYDHAGALGAAGYDEVRPEKEKDA